MFLLGYSQVWLFGSVFELGFEKMFEKVFVLVSVLTMEFY